MLTHDSTLGDFVYDALLNFHTLTHERMNQAHNEVEFIHDFRVANRKIRTILKAMKPYLKVEWYQHVNGEFGWLDETLSPIRNMQVCIERFRQYPKELQLTQQELENALHSKLQIAQENFEKMMESTRFSDLVALIEHLDAGDVPVKNTLNLQNQEFSEVILPEANKRLWRSLDKLIKRNKKRDIHKIRIRAKHVKYLGEASVPIVGNGMQKQVKVAAKIQVLLGLYQDSIIMAEQGLNKELLRYEEKSRAEILDEFHKLVKKKFKS